MRSRTKKVLSGAGLLTLMGLAGCMLTGSSDLLLVEDGQSRASIVTPDDATVRADIAFFTNAVYRCTGALLPVVDRVPADGNRILFDVETRGIATEDAFTMTYPDTHTLLIRGTAMSCRWALNRILEKQLGVVFCLPGPHGTHYPQSRALSLPRTDFAGDASLKLERWHWRECPDWTRSLCCKEQKGNFFNHNVGNIFPPEKYGVDPWREKLMPEREDGTRGAPEPFKLHRLERWQPCFSAPEAVTEGVKNIRAYLKAHPDEKVFSLGINDNGGWCRCARCKAANGGSLNRKSVYGGPTSVNMSEVYFKWVCAVATALKDEFPNVMFGASAYGATMDPPSMRLPENLLIDISDSVYQTHVPAVRERILNHLRAWSEKCANLSVWDYAYGAIHYAPPRVYNRTVDEFFRHKLTDIPSLNSFFAEGSSYIGEGPKRYFYYRKMYDAGCDREYELDRWYKGAVGEKAAPYLKAYYDHWEHFWTTDPFRNLPWYDSVTNNLYCNFNSTEYAYAITEEDLRKTMDLMEKAHATAMKTGDSEQRIRAERLMDFARFYDAKARGNGTASGLKPEPLKTTAEAKQFLSVYPVLTHSLGEALVYAQKIAKVKYAEPFYMSEHYVAPFVNNAAKSEGLLGWFNDAVNFADESVVRSAAKAAAEDKRTPERFAKILRRLFLGERDKRECIWDAGLDETAERKLWETPTNGLAVESLSNGVFTVVGKPGWSALKKLVRECPKKCVYSLFTVTVDNLASKPIAVRTTYTPGTGVDKNVTIAPGQSKRVDLVGIPNNQNVFFYIILNGLESGEKARVRDLSLTALDN